MPNLEIELTSGNDRPDQPTAPPDDGGSNTRDEPIGSPKPQGS